MEEGEATFVLGSATKEVGGGNVVTVPKETPHKFVNSGETELKMVAIHCSGKVVTEWLE